MANYYLRFVQDYAEITTPLRRLLKQDVPWKWTNECQLAFQQLKNSVTSAPVLAHFSTMAVPCVTFDASGTALGAVLSQYQDGQERPVAFASRALTDTEKKDSVAERKALACIRAAERWHIYLYG